MTWTLTLWSHRILFFKGTMVLAAGNLEKSKTVSNTIKIMKLWVLYFFFLIITRINYIMNSSCLCDWWVVPRESKLKNEYCWLLRGKQKHLRFTFEMNIYTPNSPGNSNPSCMVSVLSHWVLLLVIKPKKKENPKWRESGLWPVLPLFHVLSIFEKQAIYTHSCRFKDPT